MLIKYTLIMKALMSFFLVKHLYFVLTSDWGQNSRFICDFPTEFGDFFFCIHCCWEKWMVVCNSLSFVNNVLLSFGSSWNFPFVSEVMEFQCVYMRTILHQSCFPFKMSPQWNNCFFISEHFSSNSFYYFFFSFVSGIPLFTICTRWLMHYLDIFAKSLNSSLKLSTS